LFNKTEQKMATVAGVKIKPKAKKITSVTIRENAKKDYSPKWDNAEDMNASQFLRHWHGAMSYYRLEFSGKDLKPQILKWMATIGCTKEDIIAFKKTKDNRCNVTMGAIASCLLRGMPAVRADFNDGKDTAAWLRKQITDVIADGKDDIDEEAVAEVKSTAPVISIQERVRDTAYAMTTEIEDAIESFQLNPTDFDPKAFKVLNLLKAKGAKAAHARFIRDLYAHDLAELEELLGDAPDEQLREGHKHLTRRQVKSIHAFYQEIASACEMLAQEAKVNRAPRKTKAVPKEKLIAKLKFMKTNEPLKLVSINPVDIIGAGELWIFNTKTRKLGKYVASEFNTLNVKGTTITNFDEFKSVQKTVRKPEEKLKEFKAANKVALRKFLDEINATDTKMNGRINEDTILLKVA
jgi:hypothetical protein